MRLLLGCIAGSVGAPELQSVTVAADGRSVDIVFDRELVAGSTDGFTFVGTVATDASFTGGTLTLVVNQVFDGASVSVSYDAGAGTVAGASGPVESFGSTPVTNSSTHTGVWSQTGSTASFPGGTTTVTKFGADGFDSTDIVIVDDVSDAIRASRYSGSAWGALGSAYSIASLTAPGVCVLDATTVAVFKSNATAGLFALSWNGSTFSTLGTQTNITGANQGIALCRLSATRLLLVDSQADYMQAYDWNGSTFATVGSSLALGGINGIVRADALTSSLVVLSDAATNNLALYSFDGSAWSVVSGSTLSIDTALGVGTTYPSVCAINTTDILIGGEEGKIQAMRWNGSVWSTAGSAFTYVGASSAGSVSLVNLGDGAVAFMRASTTNSFLIRLVWQ